MVGEKRKKAPRVSRLISYSQHILWEEPKSEKTRVGGGKAVPLIPPCATERRQEYSTHLKLSETNFRFPPKIKPGALFGCFGGGRDLENCAF